MNPEIAAADRRMEVRVAARAWGDAGFASGEIVTRITSAYADDRVRYGPVFRILAFVAAMVASLALLLLTAVVASGGAAFCFFWAVVFCAVTEWQTLGGKRSGTGSEAATSLLACILMCLAVALATDFDAISALWFVVALVFGAAAARWGDRLQTVVATVAVYLLAAQMPLGRWLWIFLSAGMIATGLVAKRSAVLAPAHRRCAVLVVIVGIAALYTAVNVWSWDRAWIETLGSHSVGSPSFRGIAIMATVLLPPLLLILGWIRREPMLLAAGAITTLLSLGTVRLYHSLLPLSVALILIGSACLGLAIALRRYLRSSPAGERNGFTADPLLDDTNRTKVVRAAAAMAAFTAAPAAQTPEAAFQGRGGQFGGGGAGATF